jgi:hypothetical protein
MIIFAYSRRLSLYNKGTKTGFVESYILLAIHENAIVFSPGYTQVIDSNAFFH